MRMNRVLVVLALALASVTMGCWYQRPNLDKMFGETQVGMNKDDIIELIGQPTTMIENEMFYIYDDPTEPVRFRFVLNDKNVVTEKYFESKKELAKKAEETIGQVPPTQKLPDDTQRTYPGGPLDKFSKKPVGGYGGGAFPQ